MSLNNLQNCPSCGKLFVKAFRNVCNDCHKKDELQFQTVHSFVKKRENRSATIHEVSAATGVSTDQITRYIREGRLLVSNLTNMGYECETCDTIIKEGRLCDRCQIKLKGKFERLASEVEHQIEIDKTKPKDIGYLQIKKDSEDKE
jgi:flagellar operon protein (TIGR03826 family)